ncbi:aldose epimerase family protein [Salinimicrobium sp. GXAS 041]|uniref:aldose epimerase family protein n=1 Tax=Salinimicrobium sp. GXAS 041 TaxID=3400806 RepID=UPI003C771647
MIPLKPFAINVVFSEEAFYFYPLEDWRAENIGQMRKKSYGFTSEGEEIFQYTLKSVAGAEIEIITFGARITSCKVPDKNKRFKKVVLGFDSLSDYLKENPYFGAIVGRFGNRIANGTFSLDGKEYSLAQNNGGNHLHGGNKGFDNVIWEVDEANSSSNELKLSYFSYDMEEGYPGNLEVDVTYSLKNDNSLEVSYEAVTDKKTIVNLTQHSYFNLSGNFSEDILGHEVKINADKFLPVDQTQIPTGEIREVENTPFDFRKAKLIGENIEDENEQLKRSFGFDHCWILKKAENTAHFAASSYHKESGRLLEVFTTEPGVQFYSGNFLDGTLPQKGGKGTYTRRSGFCFETQHFPDSPNQRHFPSVELNPGEKFSSKTIFKFSVK